MLTPIHIVATMYQILQSLRGIKSDLPRFYICYNFFWSSEKGTAMLQHTALLDKLLLWRGMKS